MINIFPLTLLQTAKGSQVFVEVKNGDTYNGKMENVDKYMNIKLTQAIHTNKDGSQFHQIKEIMIKGFAIKYFRLQPQTIDKAIEEAEIQSKLQEEQKLKQQKRKQPNPSRQRGTDRRGRSR